MAILVRTKRELARSPVGASSSRRGAEPCFRQVRRSILYTFILLLTGDDSLGERYGLRIIPGENSFLVLPNNISRSTAVGAILNPGGPAHSHSPAGPATWVSPDAIDIEDATSTDFVLAVTKDEKLMRRLNELDNAETCSTGNKGTDAKWKLKPQEVIPVLRRLADVN